MNNRNLQRSAIYACGLLLVLLAGPCMLGGMVWREWRQERLNQALIAAIKRNDARSVQQALRQGASANARSLSGPPPSLWSVAKRLLRHKPVRQKAGASALALTFDMKEGSSYEAHLNVEPAIIRALLDGGADVNTRQQSGVWANTNRPVFYGSLVYAAELCHNDAVFEMALQHGADPDSHLWNAKSDTLLMKAASEGNVAYTKLLLHCGAKVDARGDMEITALLKTALDKVPHRREVIQLLLDAGADINATMENGRGIKDGNVITLLADEPGENLPLIHLLLERGASVDDRDARQRTALFFAVGRNNIAVVRELLSHGANVNATDKDGVTPYSVADKPGPMRRLLRKAGAKPSGKPMPPDYWS